ncbi:hypothetical protein M407DRAFT_22854 [Tulasnella calospora MUT 4182]|uniref:Uncharacterized protein n=1 Tax=Tulasnella calospora MUT 4182 TaxID=1051891 RepID=A0A0C3QBP0_9AGAM|nr:hypothetical protein M407DRAFT_22854 [Tulasnella calospora MUT 4182]
MSSASKKEIRERRDEKLTSQSLSVNLDGGARPNLQEYCRRTKELLFFTIQGLPNRLLRVRYSFTSRRRV